MKFYLLFSILLFSQWVTANSCYVERDSSYTLCAQYTAPQKYLDLFKENCKSKQGGIWSRENQCLQATYGCKIDTDNGVSVKVWYVDVDSVEAVEFACNAMGAKILHQ